ncbi:MAG TPA: peptidoglycan-associated lipoprotein Pal [Thermoanaerobaculia bacterium]|nr:peptidoglycan-associated lipoprotein Pal [Thermoanaerobaculia bacterium]
MIRRIAPLPLALALVALFASACGSKKQPPPVSPSQASTATSAARPESAPAPTPRPAADADDIWSADLATLNEYLQREGLLGEVYFAYDQHALTTAARERLDRNARFLAEHPELVVTIEGHCDERGTSEYNLALGERRAQAALGHVQGAGVLGSRLNRISYGKERPVCQEGREACWSKNRRASFVVTGRLRPT